MTGATGRGRQRPRAWWRRWWVWYLVLLAASHLVPVLRPPGPTQTPTSATRGTVDVSIDGAHAKLSYLDWAGGDASTPPVILLHGSPGAAEDFVKLGPLLAHDPARPRRVIAVDQLGFGESSMWVGNYSILADARAVLELMDHLGIERAHVVGWSNGGGTALHLADLAPQRIASLTMMASIGDQETEGSQSYFFEHAKYDAGLAASYAAEALPHFGLFGNLAFRHSAIRFFMDSDQRALTRIMRQTQVPTLILHGRHDFLVPAWQAERHHAMMPASRLVMINASHFLPFLQAEESARWIGAFIALHDEPGIAPQTDVLDLAPVGPPRDVERLTRPIDAWLMDVPWTVEVGVLVLLSLLSPALAAVIAAIFVHDLTLNFSVAWVGLVAGRLVRMWGAAGIACLVRRAGAGAESGTASLRAGNGRLGYGPGRLRSRFGLAPGLVEDWQRRLTQTPARAGWMAALFPPLRREAGRALGTTGLIRVPFVIINSLGAIVASLVAVLGAIITIGVLEEWARGALGWIGVAAVIVLACIIARHAPTLLTRPGRQRLRGRNSRVWRREYWPAFLFYLPLVPYATYLAIKHRGFTLPTCVNPGIEAGGGTVGESKHAIMRGLGAGRPGAPAVVLPTVMIEEDPDPQHRADQVAEAMQREPGLGAFPIVLKPDSGQRGFGVRVARSREDVVSYLRSMTRPAIVQPYHPGPYECGVLWVRCAETLNGQAGHGEPSTHPTPARTRAGFVYSITGKEFPELVGDGRRSLEELIYAQRRYRRQADIFLERFAADRSRVPALGERIRLALSGNHCQGTLFRDGGELLTPEVELAFDELATAFSTGALDFGRFDVRFESPDEFRRGRGFSVLELNGATGESTNLYDPDRSLLWSYRVLFGQWRHLYELGAARRDAGATPMSTAELLRSVRAHYKTRRGSALAD